jgi:ElaB/YqjD/DUF883 family membrane-anchored ribosome-binding protein
MSTTSIPFPTSQPSTTIPNADAGVSNGAAAPLLDRVVKGAHETIDRLAESAAPHVHKLEATVGSASHLLQAEAGKAREMGNEWTESVRCTVRDNPLAAVAVALVAGALVARLLR